ncbi:MAG: hypothetical protein KAX38_07105, partial [Candidatus Krumholzibacteria bacterium]|nr:hypothetical protein [Candidatus Krumholzibacteria bacterium]
KGRLGEAYININKAVELNPRDAGLISESGIVCMFLRKYQEAERNFDRSISLEPDFFSSYVYKARNYLLWQGELRKYRQTLEKMPKKSDMYIIWAWFLLEVYERKYETALDRLSSSPFQSFEFVSMSSPKPLLEGLVYQYMKKPELAHASFESARLLLEKKIEENPRDPRLHSALGIVYAGLGLKEGALREGKAAVELSPISRDSISGPSFILALAHIYVMIGEHDAAIEQIDYIFSIPFVFSVQDLRIDPKWDPLREHPKYQRLLDKYSICTESVPRILD